MEFKDYYATLGGRARRPRPRRSSAPIASWRAKYHPDVSKASDAESRFKEVGEAYEVLKDADKARGPTTRPASNGAPDRNSSRRRIGTVASNSVAATFDLGREGDPQRLLRGALRRGSPAPRGPGSNPVLAMDRRRPRGEDHHAKILIDVDDSYRGARRSITLSHAGD